MLYLLNSNLPKHSISLYLILSLFLRLTLCPLFDLYLLRVTLYDYQALCWVYSESSDSGHTLLDVSTALFHTFQPAYYVFLMSDPYFVSFFFSLTLLSSQP